MKEVNKEVKRAVKIAKVNYKNKVEENFPQGNLHSAWQGLKRTAAVNSTTNSNPVHIPGSTPSSLSNDLNSFYSRLMIPKLSSWTPYINTSRFPIHLPGSCLQTSPPPLTLCNPASLERDSIRTSTFAVSSYSGSWTFSLTNPASLD